MSASSLLRFELPTSSSGSTVPDQSSGDGVALRISGSKPLRVRGELLAECSSWSAGAPAWHELVLYRSDAAGFAAGIRTCRGPMGASDVFHARMFPDLDAR